MGLGFAPDVQQKLFKDRIALAHSIALLFLAEIPRCDAGEKFLVVALDPVLFRIGRSLNRTPVGGLDIRMIETEHLVVIGVGQFVQKHSGR